MSSTSGNGVTPSLRTFNESLLSSAIPFTADESSIARAAYAALLADTPVSPADLASRVNLPVGTVERVLADRPGVARLTADGQLEGYLGLSRRPTPHRFVVHDQTLFVWCVWDGLFLPRVLGRTARLTSRCPVTGHPIALFVGPDGVLDVDPASAVMSFVASSGPAGNGAGACCPYIHFLESPAAGKQWQSGHPTGCVLTIDHAWSLARSFVDTKLLAADAVELAVVSRP
jgi:alkylmercury lyase